MAVVKADQYRVKNLSKQPPHKIIEQFYKEDQAENGKNASNIEQ